MDLLDSLNEYMEKKNELTEIIKGAKKAASKYLQRFGVPGHYTYIYPSNNLLTMGRKTKNSYKRFLKRSRNFMKKLGVAYGATSINLKPTTWKTSLLKMNSEHGENYFFKVNLFSHKIYSYRSRRINGGLASKLSRDKKKGILRYR